jgi:hypothetical protein
MGAFYNCINLREVIFKNDSQLADIDVVAFMFCQKLTSIILPERVEAIKMSAFRYSGLTSITIPNSVAFIGALAFFGCENLASIYILGNPELHNQWKDGCNATVVFR